MSENRDFKGVWIPKEIWLNKELSAIEKFILTEISSLDNENHCTAGNEYFAEFCQCSVPTVTRAIKHLKDLNYIETEMVTNKNGSYRLIKMIRGCNQNDEGVSSKRLGINIYNNTNNNEILSKDNISPQKPEPFDFGKPSKTRSTNKSEYNDAMVLVNSYTNNSELKKVLTKFVTDLYEIKGKQRYHLSALTIKNYLDELDRVFQDDTKQKIEAVNLSIRYSYTTKVMVPNNFANNTYSTKDTVEHISDNDYDKYNHTKSERSF